MKILICGDSFSADWTVKYPGIGWPNMLANDYQVTNLSQAGCGEYKIYLQLLSVDLTQFDKIIVSHTSPNRIYIKDHPVHAGDPLHKDSDLIYTDLKDHAKRTKSLQPIIDFYENYFEIGYAEFVHSLICEKIKEHLSSFNGKILHIANLNWENLYQFDDMLHFEYLFKTNRGLMNHFNDKGNAVIYNKIKSLL